MEPLSILYGPVGFCIGKNTKTDKIDQGSVMLNGEYFNVLHDGNQVTFPLNHLLSCDSQQPNSANTVLGYKYTINLSFESQSTRTDTEESCIELDLYTNNESLFNGLSERFTNVLSLKWALNYTEEAYQYGEDYKEYDGSTQCEEKEIEMALDIFELSCDGLCGQKYEPYQLFFCIHRDCEPQEGTQKILCAECGAFSHTKSFNKSHSFSAREAHVICVADLMKPDAKQFEVGLQSGTLIKHFATIQKILFRQRWLLGVVSYTTAMGGATGVSAMVNGAPTVIAACAEGSKVIPSALGVSALGGGIGTLIGTTIEWAYIGRELYKKRITKQEAMKLGVTALAANTVSAGSYFGFMAIGAAIGTPAGPIGSVICAVIGAIVCGLGTRYAINKMCEKYFERKHETESQFQKEALQFFFHDENYDIYDQTMFNAKILKRTYRRLAVICHPDRKGGDHQEWLKLSAFYGILTAIVDQQEELNTNESTKQQGLIQCFPLSD